MSVQESELIAAIVALHNRGEIIRALMLRVDDLEEKLATYEDIPTPEVTSEDMDIVDSLKELFNIDGIRREK